MRPTYSCATSQNLPLADPASILTPPAPSCITSAAMVLLMTPTRDKPQPCRSTGHYHSHLSSDHLLNNSCQGYMHGRHLEDAKKLDCLDPCAAVDRITKSSPLVPHHHHFPLRSISAVHASSPLRSYLRSQLTAWDRVCRRPGNGTQVASDEAAVYRESNGIDKLATCCTLSSIAMDTSSLLPLNIPCHCAFARSYPASCWCLS